MCGICGIFDRSSRHGDLIADEISIRKMTNTLRHRGPDHMGTYLDRPIALGNTRLSIIDLSDSANQPMTLMDGAYAITFNGEIYNYIELRKDLESRGVRFGTTSDTEVLLQLYIHKGTECLNELRGMFAFAIWNRKEKRLFLARDRVGEKPLVYTNHKGLFCFGSEIKSLLSLPQLPREIDPVGLHYGLHYVNIPAPYSAFKNIRKLRPSEYMMVTSDHLSIHRYWKPKFNAAQLITDPEEAACEFNRCLDETVSILCRSDVPIGATLSGGLDSSAVVASMCRSMTNFDTFCISGDIEGTDTEISAARMVAAHFNTNHHELTFKTDQLSSIQKVIRSFDEPVATFVPLHAYTLASLVRNHVKVAMTGNGGDELFGGYSDHQTLRRIDRKLNLWNQLEKWHVAPCLDLIPLPGLRSSRQKYQALRLTPLNRIAVAIRFSKIQPFYDRMYSDKMKSLVSDSNPADLLCERFDQYGAPSLMDGLFFQQLMVSSQHSIVDIPDISGMANSLEYRSPFLDVKMMELAMRIPAALKVGCKRNSLSNKVILRKALASRLPAEIVKMEKRGFGSAIPYHSWVMDDWSEYITKRLRSPALQDTGLFEIDKLAGYYEYSRMIGQAPMESFWGVVMISEWLDTYF